MELTPSNIRQQRHRHKVAARTKAEAAGYIVTDVTGLLATSPDGTPAFIWLQGGELLSVKASKPAD